MTIPPAMLATLTATPVRAVTVTASSVWSERAEMYWASGGDARQRRTHRAYRARRGVNPASTSLAQRHRVTD
jgi:hypothetical protein